MVMGIVGLPNVGKSSLFNALTKGDALVENRPFATIEPNLGVVKLLDPRLDNLASIAKPQKVIHSIVQFLDIAGLVKGASEGEGLGNKFLENIRGVDAICLVIRAFEDSDVFSVNSSIDPVFEAEIVLCELIYSDLAMVERVIKKLKSNDPKLVTLNKLKEHLQQNKLILNYEFSDSEREDLKIYSFLTNKPLLILANVDDSENNPYSPKIKAYAESLNASYLEMNIKLENELTMLSDEEREELLGTKDTCLNKLIALAFKKLRLSTFFTVGPKEVRS